MIVAEPENRIVDKKAPDFVAISMIEVHRRAPRCFVGTREIWTKAREVIPLGPEMVVNDIEQDGEAFGMAGIHQPFQIVRRAVGPMRREEIDSIVSPAALAGKLIHRHEFDCVTPRSRR